MYHSLTFFYTFADALILTLDYPMLMCTNNSWKLQESLLNIIANWSLASSWHYHQTSNFWRLHSTSLGWCWMEHRWVMLSDSFPVWHNYKPHPINRSGIIESNSLSSALFVYLFTLSIQLMHVILCPSRQGSTILYYKSMGYNTPHPIPKQMGTSSGLLVSLHIWPHSNQRWMVDLEID